jgi:hypothetical protein
MRYWLVFLIALFIFPTSALAASKKEANQTLAAFNKASQVWRTDLNDNLKEMLTTEQECFENEARLAENYPDSNYNLVDTAIYIAGEIHYYDIYGRTISYYPNRLELSNKILKREARKISNPELKRSLLKHAQIIKMLTTRPNLTGCQFLAGWREGGYSDDAFNAQAEKINLDWFDRYDRLSASIDRATIIIEKTGISYNRISPFTYLAAYPLLFQVDDLLEPKFD